MNTLSYNILDPNTVIKHYKNGIFPMGDQDNNNHIFWCNPLVRAIIPISKLHISRSLKRLCNKKTFKFSINYNFAITIENCADRDETWINESIISTYKKLHNLGYAHSIEIWEDNKIKGGLYGVAIGKAFFAESMFSESSNGSKIALIVLMGILELNKFQLLDVQFMTDHLKTMGAKEISRNVFLSLLQKSTFQQSKFAYRGPNIVDKSLIYNAEKRY